MPEIQIFGGGAHARGRVDLQDFMVICPGAGSFAEALEWTAEVYYAAGARLARKGTLQGVADEGGYWPSFKSNEEGLAELVARSRTPASSPGATSRSRSTSPPPSSAAGRYLLALENRTLVAEQFARDARALGRRAIPSSRSRTRSPRTTHEAMRAFTKRVGHRIQIVGDDYFVTDAARDRRPPRPRGACNTVLIKPNQVGTVSETYAAVEAAKAAGYGAIVSARSGETEDVSIVHLAVGWGVPQLKVGSFSRSERMAKWNEALRIEESLGSKATGRRGR